MSFKINLKPFPAAEYFTVREHVRSNDKTPINFTSLLSNVSGRLKSLFDVPNSYNFYMFDAQNKDDVLSGFRIITKDDPATGIDTLKQGFVKSGDALLDLSYSFPQVPANYAEIAAILIDPNISLGVPSDLFFLFLENGLHASRFNDDVIRNESKSLVLLEHVLNDYIEKGRDVLLRESNYKAAVLNQLMEDCSFFQPVTQKHIRSKTVILAETDQHIISRIEKMGYEVGTTIENDKAILAIANYPTHSKELIEMFVDRMMAM